MAVEYESLPFDEAITFFRGKLKLPTKSWTDIWEGMHSRAFVIAGATKQELLTDFHAAIDKAISDGTTLEDFRKDFDNIVEKHGWTYKGGRGWRTRVIYDTNIRQAYNAGREKQMQNPKLQKFRPYGIYKHGDSAVPRPEHLALNNTVLPLADPWWDTWTPSNGWGCTCKKYSASERDIKRMKLTVLKKAPPTVYEEKVVGKNGPNPRTVRVPRGIDPGFAYNPGNAAWGKQLSESTMDTWKAQGSKAWEPLTHGAPETYARPDRIPADKPKAKTGPDLKSVSQMTKAITGILGGDEKVIRSKGQPILVNAESLATHVDRHRSQYLPFLEETIKDPFEVWLQFERHKGTGKVVLRSRYMKKLDLGDKQRGMLVVANVVGGMLEAWTVIPVRQAAYLEKQRRGFLLWGRK